MLVFPRFFSEPSPYAVPRNPVITSNCDVQCPVYQPWQSPTSFLGVLSLLNGSFFSKNWWHVFLHVWLSTWLLCPQNGPYLYHYCHFFSFNYQNHTISYLAALYLFQSLLIQQDLQSTELTNRFFEKQVLL